MKSEFNLQNGNQLHLVLYATSKEEEMLLKLFLSQKSNMQLIVVDCSQVKTMTKIRIKK